MPVYTQKTLTTLPSTFTFYQGGLYIGNFYPGPPANSTSSDLLGNKNTGSPVSYKSYANGNGDKNFAWGIVIASKDYSPNSNSTYFSKTDPLSSYDTSEYDGYYNSQENTNFYNHLRNTGNYNGYKDWYVPSVDELAFIIKNMPTGYYIPKRFDAFSSTVYRSSTYQKINSKQNSNFFYAQSFDKTKYGTVTLVSRISIHAKTRLIRKINLVNI